MTFKEKHKEYQKARKEYVDKVKLWFTNHECNNTCPLYRYHSIDKTSLNSVACEYIAEKYVNEVSDIIENWYDDYKKDHTPISKFYQLLGIDSKGNKPWKNFDKNCDSICDVLVPCVSCSWWKNGFI